MIVFLRNKFFDWNILKQKEYPLPVICVGNITVGGTGKTPHTEYLIELLRKDYKVAVLSRGYKRKTKGFLLASPESTAVEIGDEPYQIKNKYPDVLVAVDAKRQRGIETLLTLPENQKPDLILLDDAFQHRYVKPSLTLLLTDYNRIMTKDVLLPAGRLREPAYYAERANIVIVTKCPTDTNPLDQRILSKDIHLYPYQDLFFTTFNYGMLIPVFGKGNSVPLSELKKKDVLLVAGIANPKPFLRKVKRFAKRTDKMLYPDHHHFTEKDLNQIKNKAEQIENKDKMIIITEKDAARFKSFENLEPSFKSLIYYLPIEVNFVNSTDQEVFNNKILDHVRENTTNS